MPIFVCDVANGAMSSAGMSGRLTDHLAIGVLTGLIQRGIIDDVILNVGNAKTVTAIACACTTCWR